jgi:hypothetical protein
MDEAHQQRDAEYCEREPGSACRHRLNDHRWRRSRCGLRGSTFLSRQAWYASAACSEDGTAERAETAEKILLCGLCGLCGFFFS